MVEIGCCVNEEALVGSGGRQGDLSGLHNRLTWFRESGYDFLELSVTWLAGLSQDQFVQLAREIETGPVHVVSCNSFVPGELRIIGPNRDEAALLAYLRRSLARVKEVGAAYVVFGSGKARAFPDDYPGEKARDELRAFARHAADEAERLGLTIVVEPLRHEESNVLNSVGEGFSFVQQVEHPHLQLLADSFHMEAVDEPLSVLERVRPVLRHVHTADTGRCRPGGGSYDHKLLFRTLHEIGYEGGVSVECRWEDFDGEAPLAAAHLRGARGGALRGD